MIRVVDGQIVDRSYSFYKLRKDHPQTSFPRNPSNELLAPYGVFRVVRTDPPEGGVVDEAEPALIDGIWTQQWTARSHTAEELEVLKVDLKARVTTQRKTIEYGGTQVGGVAVATDPESQMKLSGALAFTGRNPTRRIKWKSAQGVHAELTAAQIAVIADAVGEFVAQCFDAEAAHYAAIDVLTTHAAIAAYDVTAGWPA